MITADKHPEYKVLDVLLKESSLFHDFYNSERPKIKLPLAWIRESLPDGIRARTTTVTASDTDQPFHVIRVREVPIPLDDAALIAEEIEHCVCDEEGFPGVEPIYPEFENLASSLTTLLADPIAHERLKSFGFDLRENLKREIAENRRQLESAIEPTERGNLFFWTSNYASYLLEGDTSLYEFTEFRDWFDLQFPNVARKAGQLLIMITRRGYRTPDKQFILYREIVEKYNLGSVLKVTK